MNAFIDWWCGQSRCIWNSNFKRCSISHPLNMLDSLCSIGRMNSTGKFLIELISINGLFAFSSIIVGIRLPKLIYSMRSLRSFWTRCWSTIWLLFEFKYYSKYLMTDRNTHGWLKYEQQYFIKSSFVQGNVYNKVCFRKIELFLKIWVTCVKITCNNKWFGNNARVSWPCHLCVGVIQNNKLTYGPFHCLQTVNETCHTYSIS